MVNDLRRFLCVILSILLLAFPATVTADTEGDTGKVVSIIHNGAASDERSLYWGAVTIRPWQGASQEYLWGGSICPGKNLDIAEVALLEQAMLSRRVNTRPFYKNGQGGYLCLVGFQLLR